jgi:predicted metal-binding protein
VPKEKGQIILCGECPGPRRKEKKKLNKNLEFPEALSTR